MRIDPLGTPLPPAKASATSAAKPAASGTDSTVAASDSNSFTPTSELTALLAAVRQSPEVRTDIIESVAAKLESGEIDTPEAAADAARTLLSDLPPPPSE